MLLRTSSTPVSQTLFSESPKKDYFDSITSDHSIAKVSFFHNHLSSFSCSSSPAHFSVSGSSEFSPKSNNPRRKPFRRAQSDGNLKGLSSISFDLEQVYSSKVISLSSHKRESTMLHTEASFSMYNDSGDDGVEELKGNQDLVGNDGQLVRSVTIGDNISAIGSGDFSFEKKVMGLIEEDENEEGEEEDGKVRVLDGVTELGIEESEPDNGGTIDFVPSSFDGNGDVEEYYKSVLKEDPSNPLFLRNYAHVLQSKGDLYGAEHYYLQATLVDPKDGEILSQYAKLVWALHHDKDRALDYFERAAHAAPEDSHVLAAYASFLWEINDESEDDINTPSDQIKIEETEKVTALRNLDFEEDNRPVSHPLHLAAGLGIGDNIFGGGGPVDYAVAASDMDGNAEEYYRRVIQENPNNPLLLRNYAHYLDQSVGDLHGAEEYYSRAILADPTDGETISQYAKLTWQLHHDKYKASNYFKRAIQASPDNSDVLASYAGFLWETEEDEDEDEASGDYNGAPLVPGVVAAGNA